MKKKLTLDDATKEELITYFFNPISGGFRLGCDKDRFLIWLQQKRTMELLDAQEASIDDSQKHLAEYVRLVKRANDTEDINEKLIIFDQANKAYGRYELAEKRCAKLGKKVDDYLGLGVTK